ncbi:hypothetical protein [Flavobacterium yafengii]|uniref:hypothetical protein n=1 Tax=Flavobacterium yafengii TaxID=3041253 RepID=UPI0024A93793|nr:hypothetical protein [Flavobacterium yafengii]MDI6046667.1 hypothetical protein [Flavobacterium yafengii]
MIKDIDYRLTPWDEKSIGLKTAEIIINKISDPGNFKETYNYVELDLINLGVEFIYTRINCDDIKLRFDVQDCGFYYAETSVEVFNNNVKKFQKNKLPKISYEIATNNDEYLIIKKIASESFNYGRFHEDINIPFSKAQIRYYNWIDDLIEQKAEIYVAKVGDTIVGFNIQKTNYSENSTVLVLAGCNTGAEIFASSLWNEIILHNKLNDINKISALISASNIGVFNLYVNFGFKIKNTFFGFHKKI